MTIGERLEDARKRKGVSIREAAEATKIRGDFLLSMENNSFDINLPEIYVRGFLKNYARFLKLEPSRIMTDYEAMRLGARGKAERLARGGGHHHGAGGEAEEADDFRAEREFRSQVPISDRPSFGRMDLPGVSAPAESPVHRPDEKVVNEADEEPAEESHGSYGADKSLYIKLGVIFAGVFAVGFLVVVLISVLRSSPDDPEINPDLAASPAAAPENEVTPTSPVGGGGDSGNRENSLRPERVTLRALGTVTVIVEQSIDRQRLFQGNLTTGQTETFEAVGPVIVRYSNGDNLVVERKGESYRMGKSGVGFNTVR